MDLHKLSRDDLKEIAKHMKQKCTGNKNVLCNRIINALGESQEPFQVGGDDGSSMSDMDEQDIDTFTGWVKDHFPKLYENHPEYIEDIYNFLYDKHMLDFKRFTMLEILDNNKRAIKEFIRTLKAKRSKHA